MFKLSKYGAKINNIFLFCKILKCFFVKMMFYMIVKNRIIICDNYTCNNDGEENNAVLCVFFLLNENNFLSLHQINKDGTLVR